MKPRGLAGVLALFLLMSPGFAWGVEKADSVLVEKSERRLYLIKQGKPYRSFPVTFGGSPRGHKRQSGDERTPEGHYVLDYKNAQSNYYRSIHISYPNAADRAAAQARGVDPGGDIMIHGQPNGWGWAAPILQFFLWTDGCIALSDKHMTEVWHSVDPGTPIEIRP